jgi:hypothetical protein
MVAMELAGELLVVALSPLRVLYRPPHGQFALAVTALVAIGSTWVGALRLESAWGVLAVVLSVPAALLAAGVCRDEYRTTASTMFLTPGPATPEQRAQLSTAGRALAVLLSIPSGLLGVFCLRGVGGADGLALALASFVLMAWLGYVALAGRVPLMLARVFDVE